jgi:hypothetical protein
MTMRTVNSTVTVARPFALGAVGEQLPVVRGQAINPAINLDPSKVEP